MQMQHGNIRLACTALGKRIVAGRPNKSGTGFVGEPVDVTSDALKVIAEKIGVGLAVDVHSEGKPCYRIRIQQLDENGNATEEADWGRVNQELLRLREENKRLKSESHQF